MIISWGYALTIKCLLKHHAFLITQWENTHRITLNKTVQLRVIYNYNHKWKTELIYCEMNWDDPLSSFSLTVNSHFMRWEFIS